MRDSMRQILHISLLILLTFALVLAAGGCGVSARDALAYRGCVGVYELTGEINGVAFAGRLTSDGLGGGTFVFASPTTLSGTVVTCFTGESVVVTRGSISAEFPASGEDTPSGYEKIFLMLFPSPDGVSVTKPRGEKYVLLRADDLVIYENPASGLPLKAEYPDRGDSSNDHIEILSFEPITQPS